MEKGFAVIQDGEFKGLVKDPSKAIELPNYNILSETTQIIKVNADTEKGIIERIDNKSSKLSVTSLISSAFKNLKKVT